MQTSLSDKPSYRDVCRLASTDNEVFDTFKTHPSYTEVLEHVTFELGQQYLDLLPKDFPFREGTKNDTYGGAQVYNYSIGNISPSSLRYLSVAHNIEKLFGPTEDFEIGEVGVGYGAQALILKNLYKWKSYTFYDLPEPLALTKKYLQFHGISNSCEFYTQPNWTEGYDLIISNYAFSELTRQLQNIYLEKVILPAKRGYLTMNFISHGGGIYSYSKDEILEKLASKNPKILPEIPLTSAENCVIIWDQNDS